MAKVERVVFLSLILDLFAFTIPLPLFPRIIEWYTSRESSDPSGFLSKTLQFVSSLRGAFLEERAHSKKWDIVLLGGLMGSIFSTLQFIISPKIGSLSDRYGRKRILLITLIGNILSAVVWIFSSTFASYMLSRVIGGLSEGNVQLAIAIISDVTTSANRSKALAYVGIAFAICFCIGPPIGAYFASRPPPRSITSLGQELNIYATPATITLVLLLVETAYIALCLPETRDYQKDKAASSKSAAKESKENKPAVQRATPEQRLKTLGSLRRLHFLFLAIFSGMEFTLTFLTFDLLDWSNTQNGKLLGSIGIASALLQGGYVRRSISKVGEVKMASRGVYSCALGLGLLAAFPYFVLKNAALSLRLLQGGALCLAFTSATVVNSLTAHASLQCDEGAFDPDTGKPTAVHPELMKGQALGKFRSSGQLGRAIGPLLACASYWTFGPTVTYSTSAAVMFLLAATMKTGMSASAP